MKTPRPYQNAAILHGIKKNTLLADECGLGKTLQAVEIGKRLMTDLNAPVLIIAPKSLIETSTHWLDEIKSQSDKPILVIDSQFEFYGKLIERPYWVLMHYEAVVKHQNWLKKTLFALIVVDEGHRIKNRKAKRTIAVKALQAHRRLIMTGTPFNRDPSEYWSLLNFLEPKIFTSYWKFRNAHIKVEIDRWGYEHVVGVKNPAQFARVLAPFQLRRTKHDVAPEMPHKIIQHVPIELNPDQRKLYDQIDNVDDQLVKIVNQSGELTQLQIKIVLTEILRLQQVSCDPALLDSPASSAKLEWLIDWLEDNEETSVIVFTKFKDTAKRLSSAKYFQTLITGDGIIGVAPKQSSRIVGTIAKMGEGLDLPHISTAIFLDREWSTIMNQAIDRIDRLGITEAKHIIYLEAQNTVDQLISQVNENNLSLAKLVNQFVIARQTVKL